MGKWGMGKWGIGGKHKLGLLDQKIFSLSYEVKKIPEHHFSQQRFP